MNPQKTFVIDSIILFTILNNTWVPAQFLQRVGKKGFGAVAPIFFTLPPLLLNLPTLDIVFWVGKSASLPTQITKGKMKIV